jgi:hypothetical protein
MVFAVPAGLQTGNVNLPVLRGWPLILDFVFVPHGSSPSTIFKSLSNL